MEAEALVRAALDGAGMTYQMSRGMLYMRVQVNAVQVNVCLRLTGMRLTLYAWLPFIGKEAPMALACNAINRTLGDGCLLTDENGQAILKQTLYLTDALFAGELVTQALQRQCYLIQNCIEQLQMKMLRGSKLSLQDTAL